MTISPRDLADTYLDTLKIGFHAGKAPDGTSVLSTPFRFMNGDPLEIALWEEGGRLTVSDRGGLVKALVTSGVDAIESATCREHIRAAVISYGADLLGGTVVRRLGGLEPAAAAHALIQAVLDAQAAGQGAYRRAEGEAEPAAYSVVREILDEQEARYRENMHVSGLLGRRYPVNFQFALRREGLVRGIIVVWRGRTPELAERWNFRFRDIRAARPRLKRVVVVDADAPWTTQSARIAAAECEAVFPPGEAEGLEDYLRDVRPAA